MCSDKFYLKSEKIISYCIYCKEPIYEGEGCIYIEGQGWFHKDKDNPLKNCYFEDNEK